MVYTAASFTWAGGLLVYKATKMIGTCTGKLNEKKCGQGGGLIDTTHRAEYLLNLSVSSFPHLINEDYNTHLTGLL